MDCLTTRERAAFVQNYLSPVRTGMLFLTDVRQALAAHQHLRRASSSELDREPAKLAAIETFSLPAYVIRHVNLES